MTAWRRPTAYEWVALGDSCAAGIVPAAGGLFEVPRDGCGRTDLSCPQVIDRDLGPLIELTDVSCGAATVEDITSDARNPIRRHLPLFSEDPDHPFANAAGHASSAILNAIGID